MVELCLRLQKDGALLGEVFLGQRPGLPATRGKVGFNVLFHREKPAVCVPQKDQAHNRQEIFVACVVRVRPQCICRVPEPFFDCFDMFQLSHL